MSTNQTQSPIRRVFDEAFNQGNLAVVDELLSSDHLAHNALGGAPNGPGGLKWLIAMYRTAFPDLHCTVEDEIRGDDKVAAHWTMCGTHLGMLIGNPPTGKQMQTQGIIVARVVDGMIVEYWMLIDQFGLLQQLGIIPR
jgi:steroid delta-isomerase-like uncharacterized protein